MRNYLHLYLKALLLMLSLTFIISCKKDTNEKSSSDKIIKVTIESSGDVQYYQGYLSVNGTINKDQKRVTVSGVVWDEETSEGEITVYEKSFDPITGNLTLSTNSPASGISFGYSAWYSPSDLVQHTPVSVTIKYFLNDKVVKTEVYNAGNNINVSPYLGYLNTSEY